MVKKRPRAFLSKRRSVAGGKHGPGTDINAGQSQWLLFSRATEEDASGFAYDLMADYDVSLDGQRFVFPKYNREASNVPKVRVILNWFDAIKRLTN